jgi:hypothetical protein
MFLLQACGGSDSSSESEIQTEVTPTLEKVDKYPDNTYCAEVNYYNPNTGTSTKNDFNVDVENNELVKIQFPNGGWLDDSYFKPEELDENGYCSFTSDKGYKYEVQITGPECDFTASSSAGGLTFADCAASLGINAQEFAEALKELERDPNEPATVSQCELVAQYIANSKGIKRKRDAVLAQMQGTQEQFDAEVNNGYIQSVLFFTMHNSIICHQLIVKKHGKYYWLEVNSSEKCTMGTMKFNSSSNDWQNVTVKESPDDNEPNGYQMRVKASSNSLSELDAEIKTYCNL